MAYNNIISVTDVGEKMSSQLKSANKAQCLTDALWKSAANGRYGYGHVWYHFIIEILDFFPEFNLDLLSFLITPEHTLSVNMYIVNTRRYFSLTHCKLTVIHSCLSPIVSKIQVESKFCQFKSHLYTHWQCWFINLNLPYVTTDFITQYDILY